MTVKVFLISTVVGVVACLTGLGLVLFMEWLFEYDHRLATMIMIGGVILAGAPVVGSMILQMTPLGYWVKRKFIWKEKE